MEVPEIVIVADGDPIQPPVIPAPGAKISTQLPKFENPARASTLVVAPTVIAVGALAGERVHASFDSLPAAATTVMPAFVRRKIASLMAEEALPPIERLRTAWLFGFGLSGERIQSRPAITVENIPIPLQKSTRTGTTVAFFAIPYFVPAAVVAT